MPPPSRWHAPQPRIVMVCRDAECGERAQLRLAELAGGDAPELTLAEAVARARRVTPVGA
jgi:hypothetical protein